MDTKKEEIPQYLYHYTNVDSLALILKNRSIRLNSLDKMDDLQEQISDDRQNFGRFVFVSSWTADSKESIPMWRMYTPKQRGVRIKLSSNPFVEYSLGAKNIARIMGIPYDGNGADDIGFKTIIPTSELFDKNYFLQNYSIGNQLVQVKYTNDKSILEPNVLQITGENFSVNVGKLGIHKNSYWEFQKEWRYRLLFMPLSIQNMIKEHMQGKNNEMLNMQSQIVMGQAMLPFNYYDLSIRDECFEEMSIMLAPDISESAKICIELLVKEYNSKCVIEESELTSLLQ